MRHLVREYEATEAMGAQYTTGAAERWVAHLPNGTSLQLTTPPGVKVLSIGNDLAICLEARDDEQKVVLYRLAR